MPETNTEQLERIEQKLDELSENQVYMMKQHGRFQGAVYGVACIDWLKSLINDRVALSHVGV